MKYSRRGATALREGGLPQRDGAGGHRGVAQRQRAGHTSARRSPVRTRPPPSLERFGGGHDANSHELSSPTPPAAQGGPTRTDRKSTRLNSSHAALSRMPSSASQTQT